MCTFTNGYLPLTNSLKLGLIFEKGGHRKILEMNEEFLQIIFYNTNYHRF